MTVAPSTTRVDALDDRKLQQFTSGLRGQAIRPGAADYDEARRVWNGAIDRRPGLIVRSANRDDVVASVRFAAENGLLLAVRGGGHNVAGFAVCDGGLVIDLSAMRDVEVDAGARTAKVGGGARWADFDRATQQFGLATTGGAISSTGVGGLTLGGGIGWLMRTHGLASDNLRSAELITAEGKAITASPKENADLFWGLCGGGGNFGVVTRFEFDVHPVGTLLAGKLIHPLERAPEALRFYREVTAKAPDGLALFFGFMTSPEGMPVVAFAVAYNGPMDEAERVLAPIRAFGPPLADMVGPMAYTDVQTMMDEAFPAGIHVYWQSHMLSGLEDAALDTLVEHFGRVTSPLTMMLIEQYGGAVSRRDASATAFPHRDAEFGLVLVSRWTKPAEADRNIAWTRGVSRALDPFKTGAVYVNYLGDEGAERVRSAYGPATYARLIDLKKRYDPNNLFRVNQNISA